MIVSETWSCLCDRIFKRTRAFALLVVGISLCGIFLVTAPNGMQPSVMTVAILLPFAFLGLGPVPWQWTGDAAPKAEFLRGLAQSLVISGVFGGLIVFFMYFWGPPMSGHDRASQHAGFVHSLGPVGFLTVAMVAFGRIISEMEDRDVQKRTAEDLFRQAHRQALQSQMEPHTLYNALSNLAALIEEDDESAEEVVVLLADLYRMLTQHVGVSRVPLSEERHLVEAYLAMERMRLGDRLEVQWMWGEGGDQVIVMPLLLLPLVENAIKHGIAPTLEGGTVVITYERQGNAYLLQVANTGRAPEENGHRGVGLKNLEARLALWGDAEGELACTRRGEWTLATIRWAPKGVA